jgi:RNA polymerase sigma-70 factor, ECF subfamily
MDTSVIREFTDSALVAKALEKADDFAYLIERYEAKLFRYIQRTLFVNKEDAEDILQEVFIKTYRNLNSYNSKYKFSSWIYRITYNTCISYYRSNQKYRQQVDLDIEQDIYSELVSDVDLDGEVVKDADRESVKRVLNLLDEKYRTVLVLKFIEEKDYNEISEILQISSGTVGSLINRGKAKFKELIKNG